MKPRIFLSSASRELKTVRQLVANTLTALGYEPVWQDIFDTSSDDIRPMLRNKIDSCSAVLQIVGDAYGAEPPKPDDEFGRVSYTQYEMLYAKSKGKRVYYLIAQDDLPRDASCEEIDVPHDDSPEAIEDAARRAGLQAAYRDQILAAEQVYYPVGNHSETELSVRRMRDDLAKMRRRFRGWMIGVSAALILIIGGIAWQLYSFSQIKEYIANSDRMRGQIVRLIDETYELAIAKSKELKSWRDRDEAVKLAQQQRDDNLERVDEYLNSIVAPIESGLASPESIEFARVLEQEGADEAIAFIAAQKKQILRSAERSKIELRKSLAPLLKSARLLANKGEYEAARQQCDEVLDIAPAWPEALHVQIWHLIELGDLALRYKTVDRALVLYQESERLAKRLAFGVDQHTEAQRDLSASLNRLGDVYLQLGRAQDALKSYQDALKIYQTLAQTDTSDLQKQRGPMISFIKLGYVYMKLGRTDDALKSYQDALKISQTLAQADTSDLQKQRDLSASFERLGNVYLQLGRTDDALKNYQDALKIYQMLARDDTSDSQKQRDLSVSFENLGDVYQQLGRTKDVIKNYQSALKIRQTLAQADSGDSQKQRDLSVALGKLGDVYLQLERTDDAFKNYQDALNISQTLAQADTSDSQKQRGLLISNIKLGDVYLQFGRTDDALKSYQDALNISQTLAQADASDLQKQRDLLVSLGRLADVYLQLGRTDDALKSYQDGLKISQTLAQADTNNSQKQRDLAVSFNQLGDVYMITGRIEDAFKSYQDGLKISQTLAQTDTSDLLKQRDLRISFNKLGDVYLKLGRTEDAIKSYRDGLKIDQTLAQAAPSDSQMQHNLGLSHFNIGLVHFENEDFKMAEREFSAAVDILNQMIANGQLVEQSKNEKAFLEEQIARCNKTDKTSDEDAGKDEDSQ